MRIFITHGTIEVIKLVIEFEHARRKRVPDSLVSLP